MDFPFKSAAVSAFVIGVGASAEVLDAYENSQEFTWFSEKNKSVKDVIRKNYSIDLDFSSFNDENWKVLAFRNIPSLSSIFDASSFNDYQKYNILNFWNEVKGFCENTSRLNLIDLHNFYKQEYQSKLASLVNNISSICSSSPTPANFGESLIFKGKSVAFKEEEYSKLYDWNNTNNHIDYINENNSLIIDKQAGDAEKKKENGQKIWNWCKKEFTTSLSNNSSKTTLEKIEEICMRDNKSLNPLVKDVVIEPYLLNDKNLNKRS